MRPAAGRASHLPQRCLSLGVEESSGEVRVASLFGVITHLRLLKQPHALEPSGNDSASESRPSLARLLMEKSVESPCRRWWEEPPPSFTALFDLGCSVGSGGPMGAAWLAA